MVPLQGRTVKLPGAFLGECPGGYPIGSMAIFTYTSKKSPTGPTFHGPLNLSIYWLDRNLLRGPFIRSHSIFDGIHEWLILMGGRP